MAVSNGDDPPFSVLTAASFAESLADGYAARGGVIRDLFTAYVGLVAAQDPKIASKSLMALESVLLRRTSAGTLGISA